jgi:hypothetical protein
MRLSTLLMVSCCSVASLQIEANTPQYVIKSDGTVYDCSAGQGTTPRYIVKSDGVIYDTLTGTEIELDSGDEDTGA